MNTRTNIKIEELFNLVNEKQDLFSISDFTKMLNTTEYYIRILFKNKEKRNELNELMFNYYNENKRKEIIYLFKKGLSKKEISKEISYKGNISNFLNVTLQTLIDENIITNNCKV